MKLCQCALRLSGYAITLRSMSDVNLPVETKPKRVEIRGKLKATIDAMVWEGLEWNEAAKKFNFHVRSMRNALARPAVQAYIRSERQVLRESMSPRNIHRLREIRDAADNMPAVQAIRTLEGMGDQQQQSTNRSAMPGLVVQINVGSGPPLTHAQPVTINNNDGSST